MAANIPAILEMIAELNTAPIDISRIAEKSGLHRDTVYKYMRRYRNRGLVRIAEWHRNKLSNDPCQRYVPYYLWNQAKLPDEPKPRALTDKERQYRVKQRKDNELKTNERVSSGY